MTAERDIYVPPEGPPQGINPDPQIYAIMGEDAINQMLEDFYLELEKSSIRSLFPPDMKEASKRSAAFFVFILGGPPLYQQLYGLRGCVSAICLLRSMNTRGRYGWIVSRRFCGMRIKSIIFLWSIWKASGDF